MLNTLLTEVGKSVCSAPVVPPKMLPVSLKTCAIVLSAVLTDGSVHRGDMQQSLTTTTVIFAVMGLALYLWCFATAREVVHRSEEKVSLRKTVDMVRHNRPLIVLCASSLLLLTGMFSLQTVFVYYARDVLGNADLYIVLTVAQTIGMVPPRRSYPWPQRPSESGAPTSCSE